MAAGDQPKSPFTLVNVFTVDADQQQQLVDTLLSTIESVARPLPGFVQATVLRGLDGDRVINYAQWEDRSDFQVFMRSDGARERLPHAVALGKPDGHHYEVARTVKGEGPLTVY